MRYFLTGTTGFIGGHIAKQLRAVGHEVVALVRDPTKARNLSDLGIILTKGDVTDPTTISAPMTGCDGVFHVAGWYKVGGKLSTDGVKVNIEGTRNVLTAMQTLKIPRGIYTSTLAVFSDTHGAMPTEEHVFTGTHLSEYDRTKAEAHKIAEEFVKNGLPLITVQPGLVYGPNDTSVAHDLLAAYLTGKLPLVPEQSAYCWAHVEDIARAHILAMEKGTPGESYIIAGPRHTLIEALAIAEGITKIPAPKRTASPQMLRTFSQIMGVLEKVFPVPVAYSSEYLRVSAGVTYLGDNTKAKNQLGYNPRPLIEGSPRHWRGSRRNSKNKF
jgi:nucleoside-diphosphate-sugar epimerase